MGASNWAMSGAWRNTRLALLHRVSDTGRQGQACVLLTAGKARRMWRRPGGEDGTAIPWLTIPCLNSRMLMELLRSRSMNEKSVGSIMHFRASSVRKSWTLSGGATGQMTFFGTASSRSVRRRVLSIEWLAWGSNASGGGTARQWRGGAVVQRTSAPWWRTDAPGTCELMCVRTMRARATALLQPEIVWGKGSV